MNGWFHSFSPNPKAKIRLFCFPFGGGGPSAFRDWHKSLPAEVEPICAHLPGREIRFKEPLISDLDVVCRHMLPEFRQYADKPYVFFGHSLGGLISYYLASQLIAEGLKAPDHVVVSGRSAPTDNEQYYDKITHLPDEQFLEKLPEYGGTPEPLLNHKAIMRIYLPILRSDFLMSESNKRAERKLNCPISVFGGLKDRISREKLQLWEKETTNTCDVKMFPGSHFFVNENKDEVITEITRITQRIIDR